MRFASFAGLEALREELAKIVVDESTGIDSYYQMKQQLDSLREEQWSIIQMPKYIVPFMQPGRLIRVRSFAIFIFFFNRSFE